MVVTKLWIPRWRGVLCGGCGGVRGVRKDVCGEQKWCPAAGGTTSPGWGWAPQEGPDGFGAACALVWSCVPANQGVLRGVRLVEVGPWDKIVVRCDSLSTDGAVLEQRIAVRVRGVM